MNIDDSNVKFIGYLKVIDKCRLCISPNIQQKIILFIFAKIIFMRKFIDYIFIIIFSN